MNITRDDLRRLATHNAPGDTVKRVTDEEFDRLARKAGYFHDQDVGATVRRQSALIWIADNPGKALRALLTDQCEFCDGQGGFTHPSDNTDIDPCPKCDGRGWLPKDGVIRLNIGTYNGLAAPIIAFSAGWLEANHE